MTSAFAVFTSDPNLIRCELARLRPELQPGDGTVNAVGMGSYAQDDVLLQRYASVAGMPSQSNVWTGPESEAFLFHSGQLPVGLSLEENAQPFRYRRWMFCQLGSGGTFARYRAKLLSLLPEFLQRRVIGETEAEASFALFLKLLREAGMTDDERLDAQLGGQLLGKTVRTLIQLASECGSSARAGLSLLATNGRMLLAARMGSPALFYTLLEGSDRCERCGLEPASGEPVPLVREHRLRRTVAVANQVARPASWIELPDGALLAVDRKMKPHLLEI